MKMKKVHLGAVLLLLLGLAALLLEGDATSAAQGYMVRAILLEETGAGYTVGVIYQDPEAAANSAEVQAPFTFAQGEGESLAAAFQALAQNFAVPLSYQLSDYLLLCGQCSKETVDAYALDVQTTQQGRYAAQLSFIAQNIDEIETILQENPEAAQTLLDRLEENDVVSPYLYQVAEETVVMPYLALLQDGTLAPEETLYLLSQSVGEQEGEAKVDSGQENSVQEDSAQEESVQENSEQENSAQSDGERLDSAQEGATRANTLQDTQYDQAQTQLYYLLSGKRVSCDFATDSLCFTVTPCVLSWSDALTGVSSDWNAWGFSSSSGSSGSSGSSRSSTAVAVADDLPTISIYCVVTATADTSSAALANMKRYIEAQANASPALLAQVGASRVEVHLICLADLW